MITNCSQGFCNQTSIGFGLTVPENESAAKEHAGRVREMFGRIARRYDLLNHLLSVNVDKRWRRIVANRVREKLSANPRARVLDVACGTGDLSLSLFEITGAGVVGTDFCRPMLAIAAGKTNGRIRFIEGDALDLPFRDGTFDVATIAFGLRNLSNVESGLAELSRVLKPGGWVAVLEFSRPANVILRPMFNLYFRKLLPMMGGLISGSLSAYTYLPASVQKFPDQSQLSLLMEQAGFDQVGYENLTGGIAALHMGRRPE
ncbi:MAG TPA: bifunctional demethylmenaquinone methyltransferase/2-methoxy-6-polyprenyl-1,4-benzoquinol methylase UbiE [Pyrinomonadaceae bacterium]|nr:bifunctional demethylmenaquinone methyltransferase/2-methoxy-6-polyprenyl-1,4-benzoquinol methylase UbiE [Pyrinomonadaceae bacterium]